MNILGFRVYVAEIELIFDLHGHFIPKFCIGGFASDLSIRMVMRSPSSGAALDPRYGKSLFLINSLSLSLSLPPPPPPPPLSPLSSPLSPSFPLSPLSPAWFKCPTCGRDTVSAAHGSSKAGAVLARSLVHEITLVFVRTLGGEGRAP
jgi:hypothetical protein